MTSTMTDRKSVTKFGQRCSKCDGQGEHEHQQFHAYGDTYAAERYAEPCVFCEGSGLEETKDVECHMCEDWILDSEAVAIDQYGYTVHQACLEAAALSAE